MNTVDPTLQAAAEAVSRVNLGSDEEEFDLSECVTAAELEQLLTVVRDAMAAPVLLLHRAYLPPRAARSHCSTCRVFYPCPTVRALGVTG